MNYWSNVINTRLQQALQYNTIPYYKIHKYITKIADMYVKAVPEMR